MNAPWPAGCLRLYLVTDEALAGGRPLAAAVGAAFEKNNALGK